MLPSFVKRAFYLLASPAMRLNSFRYRAFPVKGNDLIRAHLGPGQRSYLDGWVNVDANMFTGKCDVWADLRYPLPFRNNSVSAFYSHHVIEHLPNVHFHLREVFRCLTPGGAYRIGGPNGDSAIRKFLEGDIAWFTHYPDDRRSIGGRLDNFIFCRREHLTILTLSYLEELLEDAGFKVSGLCVPTRTTLHPKFFTSQVLQSEFESDFEAPHTIIVEAVKPY